MMEAGVGDSFSSCFVLSIHSSYVLSINSFSSTQTLTPTSGYEVDGVLLDSFPANLDTLARVTVRYERMPGWMSDISAVRAYADLPPAARAYVERVEVLVGVPVEFIGVGPGRDAMITKPLPAKRD